MPGNDNLENIELTVGNAKALKSVDQVNQAMDKVEDKADKMAGAATAAIASSVTVTANNIGKSASAADRQLANLQRRIQFMGADPVQKVLLEREGRLARTKDPGMRDKWAAAYDQLEAKTRAQVAAEQASKTATEQSSKAAAAKVEQNKRLADSENKRAQALARVVALEYEAAAAGKTRVQTMQIQRGRDWDELRGMKDNSGGWLNERSQAAWNQKINTQTRLDAEAAAKQRAAVVAGVLGKVEERGMLSGTTGLARIRQERARDISAVAGDASAIARVRGAYDQILAAEDKLLKGKAAQKFANDLRMMGDAAGRFGMIMTTAFTLPIVAGAVAMVKVSSDMENFRVAMGSLLGSRATGEKFFSEMKEFAKTSPFNFEELGKGVQMMRALGFQGSELLPLLRKVGDAAAAMGGNPQLIERITLALGQMRAKQRVSAEEMRQLSEAGIPAWELLAKVAGISVPKAMELAEKKMFDASVAVRALSDGIGNQYKGMQETLSKTPSGQWRIFMNELKFAMDDIGRKMLPTITAIIGKMREWIKTMKDAADWFQSLPDSVQKTTLAIVGLTAVLGPLLMGLNQVLTTASLLKELQITGAVGNLAKGFLGSGSIGIGARAAFGGLTGGAASVAGSALGGMASSGGGMVAGLASMALGWKIALGAVLVTVIGGAIKYAADQWSEQDKTIAEFEKWNAGGRKTLKTTTPYKGKWDDIDPTEFYNKMEASENELELKKKYGGLIIRTGAGDEEAAKRVQAVEKQVRLQLEQAQEASAGGFRRVAIDRRNSLRESGISPTAIRDINMIAKEKATKAYQDLQASQAKEINTKAEQEVRAHIEALSRQFDEEEKFQEKIAQIKIKFDEETMEISDKRREQGYANEISGLGRVRDANMRNVELMTSKSVAGRINIEQQRVKIDEDYYKALEAKEDEQLKRQKDAAIDIAKMKMALETDPAAKLALGGRISEVEAVYQQNRLKLSQDTQDKIDTARQNGTIKINDIIFAEQERSFQRVKSSIENLFDAMVTKSRSWGDAIKNAIMLPILGAFKDFLSTQITKMLMPMLGTLKSGSGGGSTGVRSSGVWGQIFGGMFGSGGGGGFVPGPTGAKPGTTPPFLPGGVGIGGPWYDPNTQYMDQRDGSIKNISSLFLGAGPGPKISGGFANRNYNNAAALGGFGLLAGGTATDNTAAKAIMMGGGAGLMAYGLAGKQLGVAGAAGAALGVGGYSMIGRGNGWGKNLAGIGMMAGGGALLGMKLGAMFGPIGAGLGAAIGAAAGATIGLLKLAFSTDTGALVQKKVRERYGVSIDKQFGKQLWEEAKSVGGIDLYLGTQQARDLIYLYSHMTSQGGRTGMVDDRPRGVQLQQSGGVLSQTGTYSSNQSYGYTSSLPSIGGLKNYSPNPQNVYVTIQADGQSTKELMQGETVSFINGNPRVIQNASNNSMAQSSGRVTANININDPLAVAL